MLALTVMEGGYLLHAHVLQDEPSLNAVGKGVLDILRFLRVKLIKYER
jgi:hypothetical protein